VDIRTHLYTSTLLGGTLYSFTQSNQAAIFSFLSGVFIDLDHVLDFLIFSKEKLYIRNIFSWCEDGRWKKITLIFHSYEIYLILCIITYYFPGDILIGILSGMGLHLILDQIGNRRRFGLSLWFYFFIYRAFAGFHRDNLRKMSESL
jgi:hypothetical protein